MPHDGVYARLGVSGIHGVGVFALCDIPAGVNIFPDDPAEVRWVDKELIDGLSQTVRSLYTDFGIYNDGKYGVPANFNHLRASWYLNEPAADDVPNVRADEHFDLFAARDIKAGEELRLRYETFSDPLKRY